MKKILLLLLTFIVILLSGCMAADVEDPYPDPDPDPDPTEAPSVYDTVFYSFYDLSFVISSEEDILYGRTNLPKEFEYIYQMIENKSLTEDESIIYGSLLSMIQELHKETNISYNTIFGFSHQELKDECDQAGVTITTTNVLVFNQFKDLIDELINSSSYIERYSEKEDYLNYMLDTILTVEELEALEHLQIIYNILLDEYDEDIELTTITFEDLLLVVNEHTAYSVTPDQTKIETAFDLLSQLQ